MADGVFGERGEAAVRAEDRVMLSSSPGFNVGFLALFLPLALGWKLRFWQRQTFEWRWSIIGAISGADQLQG